ncbi:MAG: metallophosphoesterase family protein [Candidatus Hydrogenedentales bacterium]
MSKNVHHLIALAVLAAVPAAAHVGGPSVHDTVAGVIERLKDSHEPEALVALKEADALALLTEKERDVLGSHYLTFNVDVPVVVSVIQDARLGDRPFWLHDLEFRKRDLTVELERRAFDVWEREFDAGEVGLGVPSLDGGAEHYIVAVRPANEGDVVAITDIYPARHTLGTLERRAEAYADDDTMVTVLPDEQEGLALISGVDENRQAAQYDNLFRVTEFPATDFPDHVVLTWAGDPKTTQAIQWRTSPEVTQAVVRFQKKADFNRFDPREPAEVEGITEPLDTPTLVNDPLVHRHTALLTGLEADTAYVYSVGDGSDDRWTELAEFTTAPDTVVPFSFIYMGDAQNGLDRWGTLVHNAFNRRPDAKFFVMAGDLVNRGAERDDWDRFFENAQGIYDRRQLVPALGNHEYQGGDAEMYLRHFALPEEGPLGERTYSFEYSNALFVVLDSNRPVDTQTAWLDETLGASDATWKFAVYHHPAYSSAPQRMNPEVRADWGAVFDKHHVDLALQGHDHAYLRTYPMKDGKPVGTAADGTIYIVSVSGTKFYEQGDFDYTEKGLTNTPTYQVLDLQIDGDRLVYHAYDLEGETVDEFVIEK